MLYHQCEGHPFSLSHVYLPTFMFLYSENETINYKIDTASELISLEQSY